MIKMILSILVLFLTFSIVKAQDYTYAPFPDSNAIWSEMYYPPITSGHDPNYERFALSGEDTLINTMTYKKLYLFYDTVFNKSNAFFIGGIREDINKKVFYLGATVHWLKPSYAEIINNGGNEGDEVLLYDYSLDEGDTLSYRSLTLYDEFLVVSNIIQ